MKTNKARFFQVLRKAARPSDQPANVAHQLANLMGHAPRGLVGNAKLPFQFLCRNAIARGGHQENGKEPRDKRRGGFVEDGASGRVKLIAAPRAGVRTPFLNRVKAILLPAFRTLAAFWPSGVEHKIKASPLVWELALEVI